MSAGATKSTGGADASRAPARENRLATFLRRVGLLMWKELLQLSRDRQLLPILFIMPVLQLVLFGYVVGADVRSLPTAVVDLDRTQASKQVVDAFSGSQYFAIVARPSAETEIRPLMDGNKIGVALLIPAGFERDLAQGRPASVEVIVDGSDSKVSQVAAGYSQQIVANVGRALAARRGSASSAGAALGVLASTGIDARVRVLYNPSLRSVNVMVPGLMAMILMIATTILVSLSVVKERENGTLEQLFVTPIARTEYLLGKLLPYVVIATVQVTTIFVVGSLWFNVPFNGSLVVIASGLLLFMLAAIGQGLFVSTISRTRMQAQQATMFIMIPTVVLSGFIFPIESMPAVIVPVTYLIPLRYIIVIVRANFIKGAGFSALWPQFVAMAAFSVAVFLAALARFRKRLTD